MSVPSAVSPGASAVVVHRIERSGYASGAGHADNDYPGEFRITVTVADPSRVPAAPEGLAATVSNNVDVALSWSAPSDPGGAAVTGYRVESASGTGPWEFLATVDDQTVAFQHADAFESATTIRYRVAAINRYGTGAYATLSVPAGSSLGRTEGDLVLLDGDVPWEGRVEVFRHGDWGTVCDDHWDLADAMAACRQVGYGPALQALGNAPFGQGRGMIVLDNVDCSGAEDRLVDCPRLEADGSACSHAQDAGAVCQGLTPHDGAPDFIAAIADGSLVTLHFDRPLDATFVPAARDFAVLRGTSDRFWTITRDYAIESVSVMGRRVLLYVAPPVDSGASLLVSYHVPALYPLRSALGGEPAAPIDNAAARNQTLAGGPPPTVVSHVKRGREAGLANAVEVARAARTDNASLRELDASGRAITDLAGIADLVGLVELNLADNAIEDLSPLSGVTGLRVLDLSGNRVTDLWPLAGLGDLRRLGLRGNRVADLAPLAVLVQLRALDISGNAVADLAALGVLDRLEYLAAADNRLWDVTPLRWLTGLVRLDLSGNEIPGVAPLGGLRALVWVDLSGNRVATIDPLGRLTRLRWLWIEDNPIPRLNFGQPVPVVLPRHNP